MKNQNLKKIFLLVVFCTSILPSKMVFADLKPLRPECVIFYSNVYKVPISLIVAVLKNEGGWVGLKKENTNGSFDYGPMQINSIWLDELKKYKIDEYRLKNDGCINLMVGTWILSNKIHKYNTFYEAVGRYHSNTPKYKDKYANRIFANLYKKHDVKKMLERINRNIEKK